MAEAQWAHSSMVFGRSMENRAPGTLDEPEAPHVLVTKAACAVTVGADDGKGGAASIAVAVEVADEQEPFAAPPAPTAAAASDRRG